MRSLIARKPYYTARLDMSGTNITTSAWVQIVAKLLGAASAIEIFNPSASTMLIGVGAAGSEAAVPYTVLPGGSGIFLPVDSQFPDKCRVALKAVDATANSGYFVLNFFQ